MQNERALVLLTTKEEEKQVDSNTRVDSPIEFSRNHSYGIAES